MVSADAAAAREALLSGYRPLPGVYDELMDVSGAVRPHWNAFLSRLASEGQSKLSQRFGSADRYLKESGVFYRVYDDPGASERPWPLAHIPLLIPPQEWAQIEAGVIQRARLIEAFLADCYSGGARLAGLGIPASLITGNADFLRPLVETGRPVPRQIQIYAADLVRSPTGAWWVLRDRTQAPSGAGFALENRMALSRGVSDLFRAFNVHRLAPFFDALRAELALGREADDAGVCLLTPGPLNETYFEHTYLARYLGLRLVEGVDLQVLGGSLYLRTVAGLRKVRVLLRRIDGDFADPLELNQGSRLGVPGLLQAVRAGNLTLANALGSGLAESRALLGYLPMLAEAFLGEPLSLPHAATWWCGEPASRRAVLARRDEHVIAPAFSRISAGIPPGGPWVMSKVSDVDRSMLHEAIDRRGVDFVGQDFIRLSTMPVWANGRLEPHPFTLRVFVAATADGYKVMPGGFVLVGNGRELNAVSMQQGGRAADVWVMSEGAVPQTSLIPSESQIVVRRGLGVLPSRAADNLFWLARYIERADATLRLVRALALRVPAVGERATPDVSGMVELLFRWGATAHPVQGGDPKLAALTALCHPELEGAVPPLILSAKRAGSVIRDRFPADAWRALADLATLVLQPVRGDAEDVAVLDTASAALRTIAAVTGAQLESMNRLAGWHFLKLGLHIERALATCRFARQFARVPGGSREELDLLLELNDCQITYRSRYPFGAAFAPVMDLVILDESNPRSLKFQLAGLRAHTLALPPLPPAGRPSPAVSLADRLDAIVEAWEPPTIRSDDILGIENELMQLSDEISYSFFRVQDPFVGDGGGP